MKKHKIYIKAANMFLQSLYELKQERLRKIQQNLEGFSIRCSAVTKCSRKHNTAIERCWYKAAEKIQFRVHRDLNDFSNHLEQLRNTINSDQIKLPGIRDIVAEFMQLEDEAGEVNFDLKARTISIVTESIAFEGITFGPFEIRLYLSEIKKIAFDSPYRIIALDPNPAGSDCDVTHPHVSHEKLCEGDGYIPIRKAIQQGRINDFFTVIVQILQTYNPGSPYVAIDDWEGTPCYDCGFTVAGDDCYYCEECDRDYCSTCSTYCQICDKTICLRCSYECPICHNPVCQNCTGVCPECDETFCDDCINDENLCQRCIEIRKEQKNEEEFEKNENEEDKEFKTVSRTDPAVQSDSLGPTAVSA